MNAPPEKESAPSRQGKSTPNLSQNGANPSSALLVSWVKDATGTVTQDVEAEKIIAAIRAGNKQRALIEAIRRVYWATLEKTGDRKAAKKAVASDKKKLPGALWSGRFSSREKPTDEKLLAHSGLLCADMDELGERLADVRAKLLTSPHLWALFLSPTGDGLKAVFRVAADAEKHHGSYLAVRAHVEELTGVQIDESCKDVARLCFMSFDPDAYLNTDAVELRPIVEPAKPARVVSDNTPDISARQRIAIELLGAVEWESDTDGFCVCPGKHLHTNGDSPRDCEVLLDGAPTIRCFHNSCAGLISGANHELRSRIGKAEHKATSQSDDERGDDEGNGTDGDKKPAQSAATRLVKLAGEFAFFHDTQSRPFVRLDVKGHAEVWPVNSSQFRNLLARLYYKRTRKAINRNALADAVATLAGHACFESPEEPVFLRVAPHGENILIDLCDSQWRVAEVTATGWEVLEKSPVAFIRTGAMRPLPTPAARGSLDPLWDLLNVTTAQRPLVAGALLNCFHPHGPYFVTNFVGEQGSAKSCAARILRMLIDASENPLRSPPREDRDLLAHASNNWCVALDNLSRLPDWLSDGLCRLSTGGGHSARQLYTDGEEFSVSVKRPVILNGIEDVAARPDLAERALQIELETIPDDKRKSEKELWRKFEAARPGLFCAILDGLVCALRELPRMADAALWATAGETAFGWKRGTFIAAYWQNLSEGAIASLDAHPVGVTIRQLLDAESEWAGEPAQLLAALNEMATDEMRHAKNWPQIPRVLSAVLRRLAQALRRGGIDAVFGKEDGRRQIRLCKRGNPASFASAASNTLMGVDAKDAQDANLQPLHDAELVEELM